MTKPGPVSTIINTSAAGGWAWWSPQLACGHRTPWWHTAAGPRPRPRNYPGLVPPRPALRPRVSQGGTLASKHPSILQRAGCRGQARTRRAWDSVNTYWGTGAGGWGWVSRQRMEDTGTTWGRGGGRQATLGNFVQIHNPMICMFQFWALPLTNSLFVARHRGMRKVKVVSMEFDTILMM